ncbi:MAG: hypothetical protein LQ346_002407 [Caloplaca aetnensis]|nr:MAG: hypothetical protein LQ346_002407 [Caloplaca aetnensis]
MSKLLTVFGATGNQGGSVIKSVLANPQLSSEYKIRAVTRDPSKPSGKALADKGVEVVKADLKDKESVKKAVEGSSAVFGVTNYWELFSKDAEVEQGKNIADACKENGVSLLIWSSIPHATKMTNGKLPHLPHFDSKAEIGEYIREQNIPATFFHAGCFMSNISSQSIQKSDEGSILYWNLNPDTKMPLFDAADDTGKFVAGILLHQPELLGKDIYGASGWYTPTEIVNTIQEVSGQKTTYQQVSDETFQSFLPEAIGEELKETFMLMRDYAYYGPGGDKILAESLKYTDGKPSTFKEYVQRSGPWQTGKLDSLFLNSKVSSQIRYAVLLLQLVEPIPGLFLSAHVPHVFSSCPISLDAIK